MAITRCALPSFHDVFPAPGDKGTAVSINPISPCFCGVAKEVIQRIAHAHSPDLVVSNKAFASSAAQWRAR